MALGQVGAAGQHLGDLVAEHRPGEEVPLAVLAAERPQPFELLDRLDALGDGREAQRPGIGLECGIGGGGYYA